jgi:hypothetical protein
MGFKAFMAVIINIMVFWVVAPRSLVDDYQHFGGTCYLHFNG